MALFRYKSTAYAYAVSHASASGWNALFASGDKALVIGENDQISSGALTAAYGGALAPLVGVWTSCTEGALQPPDENGVRQLLLFYGDNYLWLRWGTTRVHETGPWRNLRLGPIGTTLGQLLPAAWQSGIDVLLQAPTAANGAWQTYFFRGERVLTLNSETGVIRNVPIGEGPDAGQPGWGKLPTAFTHDLDHILALPPAAGGIRRSLLIKGADGVILNWSTGVEKQGALTTLTPGLAKLTGDIAVPREAFSGRYEWRSATTKLVLRVDLEGPTTSRMISGDIFSLGGGGSRYENSFRCTPTTVQVSPGSVVADAATVEFDDPSTPATTLSLLIDRKPLSGALPSAIWDLNRADWTQTLSGNGHRRSPYLRTIDHEVDSVTGTAAFESYDTARAATPPGYRNRVLTVPAAFAEAGLELRAAGVRNTVDTSGSGTDLRWSTAELHAAMVANFSQHADSPQWKLWTLVATRYAETRFGFLTYGIMFDTIGPSRQGVAVFNDALQLDGALGNRVDLHTHVHELGHAFNLMHSWDKNAAWPPAPLGPRWGYGDLSWMNYPYYYEGPNGDTGENAYWADFPFRFSESELRHLRHGFLPYVIPGYARWSLGGASQVPDPGLFIPPATDESGLRLELTGRTAFEYGEPVVAELRLTRSGTRDQVTVSPLLHPHDGHVVLRIQDPYGNARIYRPLARTCHGHGDDAPTTVLDHTTPALYESAYIGSGGDGLYFAEPGLYRVTAAYQAPDGSRTVSAPTAFRVRAPLDRTDQHVGELLIGDEQGTLLTLLGSDAPTLTSGNDALQEVVERYGDHPLATYARLARGANAGRHFQTLTDSGLTVRPPDIADSVRQLTAAVDASLGDEGLDNITLNAAMRRLALVHAKDGDTEAANQVLDTLVTTFENKGVPAPVQATVTAQADAVREQIAEQSTDGSDTPT
ncbi:hypothetical protein [Streptomyces yaizuensis]|uniref:Uncharacterized protein n=1 Tax=Streptomyces yaizuensis TaxID=2989713 RepID=A0ABQ5PAI5_9ACTN|nr:hypothetical protein [Streptomyces sp. YSPA8]GLF99598.1 hypothetical protein SYYSPA8_34895 [Streptomyces sp. YSPA8]